RIAVMRNGRIEQIGTGAELYERPANQFVAFFIGTPSINLFDVTLRAEGDALLAEGPALTVHLPPELRERAAGHVGRAVRLGVRPEDLHVPRQAPFPVGPENTIHGVV